jgi:hypothetical protein
MSNVEAISEFSLLAFVASLIARANCERHTPHITRGSAGNGLQASRWLDPHAAACLTQIPAMELAWIAAVPLTVPT